MRYIVSIQNICSIMTFDGMKALLISLCKTAFLLLCLWLTACSQEPAKVIDRSNNVYTKLQKKGKDLEITPSVKQSKQQSKNKLEAKVIDSEQKAERNHNDAYGVGSSEVFASKYFKLATPMHNPHYTWPVEGKVLQHYNKSAGHEGIDIKTAPGTSIKSAADGEVIYTGDDLQEYGNLIIIKHQDNILTAYAHLSKILVSKGDSVQKGAVIGRSGKTGDVTIPQLYFSIRHGDNTINPEEVLRK